jgi:hypothetical protein
MNNNTEAVELAWGLIANAYGGNWDLAATEWRDAARRWRNRFMIAAEGSSDPWTTIYDTATIDQPAPTPADEAATPLDFAALSRAAANLPVTLAMYWPPEMRDNVFYILSLAPRLIDMAEKYHQSVPLAEWCEKTERKAKDTVRMYNDLLRAAQNDQEGHRRERDDLVAERDRLLQERGALKAKVPPKVHWRKGGRCGESSKQLLSITPDGKVCTVMAPMSFWDDTRWTTVAELLKAIGPEDSEEGRPDVLQLKTAHLDVLREFSPQKTSLGCISGASPKHYMQELIEAGVLRWDGFQVDLTDVGKVLVERVTGKQFPQEFGQDIQTRADRAVKSLLKATMPE